MREGHAVSARVRWGRVVLIGASLLACNQQSDSEPARESGGMRDLPDAAFDADSGEADASMAVDVQAPGEGLKPSPIVRPSRGDDGGTRDTAAANDADAGDAAVAGDGSIEDGGQPDAAQDADTGQADAASPQDAGADASPDAAADANTGYCPADACNPGGTCVEEVDGYSCACDPGYMGTGTQSCINIDDCPPDACTPGGSCVDGVQTYTCNCDPGYDGTGTQSCTEQAFPEYCGPPFPVDDTVEARGLELFDNGVNRGIVIWPSLRIDGPYGYAYTYAIFDFSEGFSQPVMWVTTDGASPAAAVDASGNIMLVWDVITSTSSSELWADYYDTATGGFRGPTLLGQYLGSEHKVVFAPDGSVLVTYMNNPSARRLPFVRRYLPGTDTWEPEVTLSSVTTEHAVAASLELASTGSEVIAAWLQPPNANTGQTLWVNHFDSGDWQGAFEPSGLELNTARFELAARNGRAAVAYSDYLNPDQRLFVRRYDGASWDENREPAYVGSQGIRDIALALTDSGMLHVAWQRDISPGTVWHVYWSGAAPGETWPESIAIGPATAGGREDALGLSADYYGNVRAIMTQALEHKTNYYDAQSGSWMPSSAVERVDENDNGSVNYGAIANIGPGVWLTLWTQNDVSVPGVNGVWGAICDSELAVE